MQKLALTERISAAWRAFNGLNESVRLGRASALISHKRPYDFDEKRGIYLYKNVDPDELVWNVKTTAGIDFLFAQGYGTSPGANGLNYIALSNDTVSETSGSTTLSNEIAANGLSRAQGTYAHSAGASTATVDKTFTASGSQSAQKAALFSASSSGTMQHVLSFTQRALVTNDTLQVTFTITLS